uniref:Uncharacterized protein n=1 Tax=Aureoumbra lagunensis TaxID=44058 RepID=A0A7S3K6H4_9STRA|mmetsp:Transcript_20814/g.31849  ORF Transcript_20814/g.31849 Transcript_20814/m.31849 type:complete len:491 (+) Transcript_20814:48-1520(+)
MGDATLKRPLNEADGNIIEAGSPAKKRTGVKKTLNPKPMAPDCLQTNKSEYVTWKEIFLKTNQAQAYKGKEQTAFVKRIWENGHPRDKEAKSILEQMRKSQDDARTAHKAAIKSWAVESIDYIHEKLQESTTSIDIGVVSNAVQLAADLSQEISKNFSSYYSEEEKKMRESAISLDTVRNQVEKHLLLLQQNSAEEEALPLLENNSREMNEILLSQRIATLDNWMSKYPAKALIGKNAAAVVKEKEVLEVEAKALFERQLREGASTLSEALKILIPTTPITTDTDVTQLQKKLNETKTNKSKLFKRLFKNWISTENFSEFKTLDQTINEAEEVLKRYANFWADMEKANVIAAALEKNDKSPLIHLCRELRVLKESYTKLASAKEVEAMEAQSTANATCREMKASLKSQFTYDNYKSNRGGISFRCGCSQAEWNIIFPNAINKTSITLDPYDYGIRPKSLRYGAELCCTNLKAELRGGNTLSVFGTVWMMK